MMTSKSTRDDLPLIRDFVEGLLEFLYWGPAKLQRGTEALIERRAQLPGDTG